MKKVEISIIIPSYNYGKFVAETIKSVQQQTFQNWECIVVDDGSKDDTEAVVKPFVQNDPRIKYIYKENGGLSAARNTGIDAAIGTYLQFLDADDILEPKKLEVQLDAFKTDPSLDFVYSSVMFFYNGKPDVLRYSSYGFNRPWALTKSGNGQSLLKYLVISSVIMPPMPLIKKQAVVDVGSFNAKLKASEDWEFWLRCAKANLNFKYVDEKDTRSLMRLHNFNMTKQRPLMMDNLVKLREEVIPSMVEGNENLIKLNQKIMISDWVEIGLVKQNEEGKNKGLAYLKEKRAKISSFRLAMFSFFMKIFPVNFNLLLLKFVRSFLKKWYYL